MFCSVGNKHLKIVLIASLMVQKVSDGIFFGEQLNTCILLSVCHSIQQSSSVLIFDMHWHTVNELLIQLCSSKLPLFTHKEYCTHLHCSLWLLENNWVSIKFPYSKLHTYIRHFQVIIIVNKCYCARQVLCATVGFLFNSALDFNLQCYCPLLLLQKSPKSWHHWVTKQERAEWPL